jgi:hypothetical protein
LVPRGPGANLSDGLTGTSDIPGLYGRPPTILILAGAPQGHPDLSGRIDERGDVTRDVLALDGDRQRARQGAVMPQHGGRGVAGVEQVRVQLVEVFRSQPVDPVSPDPRDEVRADGGLVALQRPLPYAARRDSGQPVLEPGGHRGCGGLVRGSYDGTATRAMSSVVPGSLPREVLGGTRAVAVLRVRPTWISSVPRGGVT